MAAGVAWFTEAQRSRLDQLTAWTLLVPVVGIMLAATVLGERPTGWTLTGLAVVLVALAIALRPSRAQHHAAPASSQEAAQT